MRSVVVVLPASMWATMPMFRILSSDTLITTPNYGTGDSGPGTGHILTPVPSPKSRLWLPSIMRKCLIRFGHAVRVLALLHGAALPGGCIQNLSDEFVHHRPLVLTRPRIFDQPAPPYGDAPLGPDLDRHLIRRPANAPGPD